MLATTRLNPDKYRIVNTPILTPEYAAKTLIHYVLETQHEASFGYDAYNLILDENLIASTFGKYATTGVNLTQALLEEHKTERSREL